MKQGTLRAVLALAGALCLGPAVQACNTRIVWQADLTAPPPGTPNLAARPPLGKATVAFDFAHPAATFQVELKTPGDVQRITLHVARTYSDPNGPVLFTLYDAAHGPLPAVYAKQVGEADLVKQPALHIVTLADAVRAVLDGRAYVVVTPNPPLTPTKMASQTAPLPELSGFITMRKEEIYSDRPGDALHDPSLHRAALTAR